MPEWLRAAYIAAKKKYPTHNVEIKRLVSDQYQPDLCWYISIKEGGH